jgi:hypothetical protein
MKRESHWIRNVLVGIAGLAGLIAIRWTSTFTLVEQSRFVVHSIALSLALLLIVSSLPPIRSGLLYFLKRDYDKVARSPFLRRFLIAMTIIGYPALIWATGALILLSINCILDRSEATCEKMRVISTRYDGARYSHSYRALLAPTTLHPKGFEIQVSRASFDAISGWETILNVCTKPGRLGYEWVGAYSFSLK